MLQSPKLGDHVSVIGSRAEESPLLGHPGAEGARFPAFAEFRLLGLLVPVIASSNSELSLI
jgi:hypothetical protein